MQTTSSLMGIGATAIAVAMAAPPAPFPAFAQQGGMMEQEMVDLSSLSPDQEVASLRYCDGAYHVTTAEDDALEFPEFNLRFKTDASDMGPPDGTPALLPASMMGDRAFVIFAAPEEISAFIDDSC